MRKLLVTGMISLAMFCAAPALLAQRGTQFHGNSGAEFHGNSGIQFNGVPGSVTDPGWRGGLHGPPASVTDPSRPMFPSRGTFGHPHGFGPHHHIRPIVPVFGGAYYGYPYFDDSSAYDSSDYAAQQQQQQQTTAPPPQVIVIKDDSGKSSDSDPRYGDHYTDSREDARNQPPPAPQPSAQEKPENVPMTTLVYRDGHKGEVSSYAIVGGNLIDLTKSPVLKKIPLASLDLDATQRQNEDNGVDFHIQ